MDGSITVKCGVQDIGGGQASSLAQIAAEVLGSPIEDVTVYIGDSALTPLAGTTTATRQLYMSGNATLLAAKAVRENLLKKAAQMLNSETDMLQLRDKKIFVKRELHDSHNSKKADSICQTDVSEKPNCILSFVEVVRACAADGIRLFNVAQFNAPARELIDFTTGQGQVFVDFTFGTHAMEVAVDTETGKVKVLKIISSFDVGQAINPLSAEGQLEGGALYGLGYGMIEEVITDRGITLCPSLAEYLIPTSMDAPDVKTIMMESGGGVGPFGAKGIGEPACVSAAAAFANAVCAAIGVRIFDLPITPEKILKALGKI
jgi:CO/xanthine dehydrogenase Mo-binding subunit